MGLFFFHCCCLLQFAELCGSNVIPVLIRCLRYGRSTLFTPPVSLTLVCVAARTSSRTCVGSDVHKTVSEFARHSQCVSFGCTLVSGDYVHATRSSRRLHEKHVRDFPKKASASGKDISESKSTFSRKTRKLRMSAGASTILPTAPVSRL